MKNILKKILPLNLLIFLTCLGMSANAYLLVLNRINNQENKIVKVVVSQITHNPKTFTINVNAHENKTLPWASTWFVDSYDRSATSNWTAGQGSVLIDNQMYLYNWEGVDFSAASGNGFKINLDNQKQVYIGIYPLQGKAWAHLDISSNGTPSIQAGG